ncbi:dihydrofolate reductase [Aerococcaceae bacterium INB8]|uniref:Dihydrofolate reductase n=1 Tax=Ruoffia halotolerans TaxID=2748684 RepID=A0A839A3M2_9LACT|nr:dihydrofolate reductase [Ruoffia halotolerans]MBA5728759.1 dihydrofolate reductase [Ruoffia halotolerans]
MITFVYAQDLNGGIGYKNDLPWNLPNDLKFFKETTMGHTMLMGRRTFESMNRRLLPGRKTVVLTTDTSYGQDIPELTVVHTIEDVLALSEDRNLMVIGGAKVFLGLIDHADRVVRTVIEDEFLNDVVMAEIDEENWELTKVVHGETDEKNIHKHRYEWWQRKEEGI